MKTAHEKLGVAFSYGKYPWRPEEVARYNSTQTFVPAAAMGSFLKSKEGKEARLWDMVVKAEAVRLLCPEEDERRTSSAAITK